MDNFIFNMFGMLVLFMFLVIIGGGISQWVKNNNSPRETVKARVVKKKKRGYIYPTRTKWHDDKYATVELLYCV